jgi:hypothetical protein
MSDRPLGDALLKLDAGAGPAADALAGAATLRDRRRVRVLTILVVVFYLLAAAGLGLYTHFYFRYIAPKMTAHAVGLVRPPQNEEARKQAANELALIFGKVHLFSQIMVLASIASLTLAALFTVLLVFVTRRVTLRQVQAGLAALSEQLRRLEPAPRPPG